jgi:tetratricopeptide (TPR) repeat protein
MWDGPRLAPTLHVINDTNVWALSLPDDIILISRGALQLARQGKPSNSDARLAYALAHELAHQRADHLWQHEFFRGAGAIVPGESDAVLSLRNTQERDAKERQADAEGLMLVTLAGYDPTVITAESDFFTAWVERVRAAPCTAQSSASACAQAQERVQQARAQLRQVSAQMTFFELGAQAYAAARFELARFYFEAFGRLAPSAVVHSNIGLTHLQQAMALHAHSSHGKISPFVFHYPTLLGETALPSLRRAVPSTNLQTQQTRVNHHLNAALHSFDRATQLNPSNPRHYEHLVITYLLQENLAMARGILDGQLVLRFGNTSTARLLRSILLSLEQRRPQAYVELSELLDETLSPPGEDVAERDRLAVLVALNLSTLYRDDHNEAAVTALWQRCFAQSRDHSRGMLFRVALQSLGVGQVPRGTPPEGDGWHRLTVGYPAAPQLLRDPPREQMLLRADQRQFSRVSYDNGVRALLDARQQVLAAWQDIGDELPAGASEQRVLARFGEPDREIVTDTGRYWAYDGWQWGIRWLDGRIRSIFQYPSPSPAAAGAPITGPTAQSSEP